MFLIAWGSLSSGFGIISVYAKLTLLYITIYYTKSYNLNKI